ncbi:MAG: acetate--CoA ligase family protein [Austwickia sp.]|nr:acetate--CoA ligase family protein [Austwickia sp.]
MTDSEGAVTLAEADADVPTVRTGAPQGTRATDDESSGIPVNYPSRWEADVVLRDGSLAHIRPIVPADARQLQSFHQAQSEESIYLRFFAPIKELSDRDLHRFTHVDYDSRAALVVTVRGKVIGIGRYDRLQDGRTAEVAFNISDAFQGKGVGLVPATSPRSPKQEHGVTRFVADVLPQNRRMMKVFTDAGYEVSHHFDDGVIAVEFTIEQTARSAAVSLAREHRAEAESMADVLRPEVVAIVGVSRRPDAMGSLVLDNLLDGGFTGRVHIVNTEVHQVRGLAAAPKVSDIEDQVDLAIIAVRGDAVLDVVRDCASSGVKAVCVISSGFAESGPVGEQRQAELRAFARSAGMRVIGPLSFGFVNNHPDVLLNATIGRVHPSVGNLGLFSQSGALGMEMTASASRRKLGLSTFISAGNRVDISCNDMLQYWIDDDTTEVVGLFLESMGNPRKFSRIARQLSLVKPVIGVHSVSLRSVAPGHTVRAAKVAPAAFDALLEQAGVIRADSVHSLMDIAELAAHQPLPRGDRVGIVGNSEGLNKLVVEAALGHGLRVEHEPWFVPLLSDVRSVQRAVEEAFDSADVDSVIVAFNPPMRSSDEMIATTLAHAAWRKDKPAVASFVGMRDVSIALRRAGEPGREPGEHLRRIIPLYKTPLNGVAALAAVTRYALWREADHGEMVRPPGLDRTAAHALIDAVLADSPEGRELTQAETIELLSAYGIELWPTIPVADADAAVAAAEQLGYPVVVRSVAEGVRDLPGFVGVRTDINSAAGVRDAHESMSARLSSWRDPQLVVQRMANPGVATVLRSHEDPLFGPVVSFGVTGPPSDVLGDITHRIPPLSDVDARDLILSLRAAPLLQGYRGQAPADLEALQDLVLRVAALADDTPDLDSLELIPINAWSGGADVLGARVVVAPAPQRKDAGRRAMT